MGISKCDRKETCYGYTAESEPVGKWIKVHPIQENDVGGYKCSICSTGFYDADRFNYCPNCGVKMDEEEE